VYGGDVGARLYVNFFQPSFKLAGKQRDGTLVRRYHPPLTPCQRLLASPFVDETVKDQLRQRFAALDPLALLKAIRDTQQELAALSDGNSRPPARTSEGSRNEAARPAATKCVSKKGQLNGGRREQPTCLLPRICFSAKRPHPEIGSPFVLQMRVRAPRAALACVLASSFAALGSSALKIPSSIRFASVSLGARHLG
jgi:hypothetical protein